MFSPFDNLIGNKLRNYIAVKSNVIPEFPAGKYPVSGEKNVDSRVRNRRAQAGMTYLKYGNFTPESYF